MTKKEIVQLVADYFKLISTLMTNDVAYHDFIRFCPPFYKYSFNEAVFIFLSRPDATQCARFEFWTQQLQLKVRKGTKGIPIVDDPFHSAKGYHVYDVSDILETEFATIPQPWRIPSDYPTEKIRQLDESSLSKYIFTTLNGSTAEFPKRPETTDVFEFIELHNTAFAQVKEAMNQTRKEYNEWRKTIYVTEHNQEGRPTNERRVTGSSHGETNREVRSGLVGTENRVGNSDGEIRTALDERSEGVRQGEFSGDGNVTRALSESTGERGTGSGTHPSSDGAVQTELTTGVSGEYDSTSTVPSTATGNRNRTGKGNDTRRISINVINKAEVYGASAFSFSNEEINQELCRGSGFDKGKYRIAIQFGKQATTKENITFLKREFGTGGGTTRFADEVQGWKDHDNKGIRLIKGDILDPCAERFLTWTEVEERLSLLVRTGKYLTEAEAEWLPNYPQWEEEYQAKARAEQQALLQSYKVGNQMPPAPYLYQVGDTVYLEDKLSFEIEHIGTQYIQLYDPSFPMLPKTIDVQEFETLLNSNPRNKHLPRQDTSNSTSVADSTPTGEENNLISSGNKVAELIDIGAVPRGETQFASSEDDLMHSVHKVQKSSDYADTASTPEPIIDTAQKSYTGFDDLENYTLIDSDLGTGAGKAKYQANVAAIKLLKGLSTSQWHPLTAEEQKILAGYSGWGGIPQAFDKDNSSWANEYKELCSLLTDEEYKAARASTLNAHYTSPEIIRAIYQGLEALGFHGGKILEPALGTGYFFGCLPESMRTTSRLNGVEIDSISGRIAQKLYPKAYIDIQGFETTRYKNNFFDIAIGNVPFGNYNLNDYQYNLLIHDYFFIKSLDKVRPGGLVVFITSKGTLDKENPKVREMIAQRADLVAAIRLPNTAFKSSAGTEVTSDIIILQKRTTPIEEYPRWVYLDYLDDEATISINSYFVDHPEMMMGTIEQVSSQFGMDITLIPCKNWQQKLTDTMKSLQPCYIHLDNEMAVENSSVPASLPVDNRIRPYTYGEIDGHLYYNNNMEFSIVPLEGVKAERLRGLCKMRNILKDIISIQLVENYAEDDLKKAQAALNTLYDQFTKKYGFINNRENRNVFRDDVDLPLLSTLEDATDDGSYVKGAVFTKATVKPVATTKTADTAEDALLLSLNEFGTVNLEYIESLTGLTEERVLADLSDRIYMDHKNYPDTVSYVTSEKYLSGDVRTKLEQVQMMVEEYPELVQNLKALEKVQPEWISATDIGVRLSSHWLGEEVINDFIHQLLDTPYRYRQHDASGINAIYKRFNNEWTIPNKSRHNSVKTTATYGTTRISAYEIIENMLNQREITIRDAVTEDGKTKYVYNHEQTVLARQKQELIAERFNDWVFADQTRRNELEKKYNEIFNRIRPREYDGSYITLRNINPNITLRPHQKNAISRIRSGENALLAHVVGAGKTFTMVGGGMELLRLGAAHKLLYVVPNHMISDFAHDFIKLYPAAHVMVPNEKDFSKDNRQRFIAKIATADVHAIIIGHSQFEKIPLSDKRLADEVKREIEALEHSLEWCDEDDNVPRYTVKQLENKKKSLETKMSELLDSSEKDHSLCFEELGVDTIFIDEAHNYKNGAINSKMSNIAGVQNTSAQKSSDLLGKIRYLNEIGGSVVFATGTPVSNSICEMYVMQRYLQEHRLHDYGIYHFDEWASSFGQTIQSIELKPEGGGYRPKTRFAQFFNVPELMNLFREVADIQTAEMLNLPVPKLAGGKPELIACEPSNELCIFMDTCIERATAIHNATVQPDEDNMLKLINEARKAGTDMRLLDPYADFDLTGKLATCSQNIWKHYCETADTRGTQLVFSDIGTPAKGKFNVYDEIKRLLIEKGLPEDEIAFIHDADTNAKKDKLYEEMRSGKKRVLLGSTQKCGAGTNIQERLIALHHIDCPWRPSDIEQREGRILRQGNSNEQVYIYRYATKQSFDSYNWQLLEQKQRFISQLWSGKYVGRNCNDIDETIMSFAEMKAIASGDPRIKERMELENDIERLGVLKRQYLKEVYRLQDLVNTHYSKRLQSLTKGRDEITADVVKLKEQPIEFSMVVNGKTFVERAEAGEALYRMIVSTAPKYNEYISIGNYKGFDLRLSEGIGGKHIQIQGTHNYSIEVGQSPLGNIARIENKVGDIPNLLRHFNSNIEEEQKNLELAREQLQVPFSEEQQLEQKKARLVELIAEMDVNSGKDLETAPTVSQEVTM